VRAAGPLATVRRLGRPLPPLGHKRPDLPRVLCELIDDALDPDPEIRPDPAEFGSELAAAEPQLSDEGGLTDEHTRERVGLTEATRRLVPFTRPREAEPEPAWEHEPQPYPYAQPAPYAYPAPYEEPRPSRLARLGARAGAGALAGLLVLAALAELGPTPPFSPGAAAVVVAVGVALLPRIGWLVSALLLIAWLASPQADREGTALLLAFVLFPVPLLLPRAGTLWSLPILAPLLGAASLAPAFVAVAALAPTMARRAGLAAAGFLWLSAGEAITGDPLLFGSPDGTESLALWQSSITAGASDAVWPLISSPALAPALVWAGFAAVLPLLVRGRSTGLDLAAATAWAVGLVGAHAALGDLMASSGGLTDARGAVLGTLLGAAAAVAAATALARRPASGDGAVGLP
jgi:hypothetical protein